MEDGLGWQESLRFASPASGRTFALSRSIEAAAGDHPGTFHCAAFPSPSECLTDLLETLSIDVSDLSWLTDELKTLPMPTWALWRQDDNGNRARVQTFTGYRKARAELARFEALGHKQTYWLDGPEP